MTDGGALRGLAATPRRLLVLLRVLALVTLAEVQLRRLPVDRAAARFGLVIGTEVDPVEDARPLRLTRRLVEHRRALDAVLRRWPWADGPCLRRSLVLGWLLRERVPRLCLGVRLDDDGALHAHAWIEVDGASIGRQDAELVDLSTR